MAKPQTWGLYTVLQWKVQALTSFLLLEQTHLGSSKQSFTLAKFQKQSLMKNIHNTNIHKESPYITKSDAHPGVVTAVYNAARGSASLCLCEEGEKNSQDEESAL